MRYMCYDAGMSNKLPEFFLLLTLVACGSFKQNLNSTPTLPFASATATSTISMTSTPYAGIPEQADDGWQVSSAVGAGFDPIILTRMLAAIYHGPQSGDSVTFPSGASKFMNINSVLIVRGGKLVFEEYFYHFTRTNTHDTFSATKSITSLLTGLAIDLGYLPGVDEPVLPWFPDYGPVEPDARWMAITVEDLLTMRSGLECNDWSPESRTYYLKSFEWNGFDALADIFSLPAVTDPGSVFSYCSAGVDLLGTLLERATGRTLTQLADHYLLKPLGITKRAFLELPGGYPDAGGNLSLTPREMARIGQMVLQNGSWEGEQLVPQDWIQTSTSEHLPLTFNTTWGNSYGYLWWLSDVNVHGKSIASISASGYGGQVITIFPSLDMVVVSTGGNFENDEGQPFQIMERYLLPAVVP